MKLLSNLSLVIVISVVISVGTACSTAARKPAGQPLEQVEVVQNTRIRVMAANLSSGNKQNYDNGEGGRIFQGLKPDVVMIQEFNYGNNSLEDISRFVQTTFGPDYRFYRESESSDQIPNGIISRYPILESGEWNDPDMPNRDFAWARLDIPGDHNLWAISVHLSASKNDVRVQEANRLVQLIQEKIPAPDYVVLGGDFNTTTRNEAPLKVLAAVVSERAPPVNSKGSSVTNMTGKKNFDYVLADQDLEPLLSPITFLEDPTQERKEGFNTYSAGLVFDSSTFPLLSLVPPIQEGDSRAPGMQHLGVIKDFMIPVRTR